MNINRKHQKRHKRHKRVRSKVFGTAKYPRLCVFRSNKYIYAQLINDEKGETLVQASDLEKKLKAQTRKRKTKKESQKSGERTTKVARAFEVGKSIAKKAKEKYKIERVVFDRGGYKYHGRVKALAEGAREEGLKF